MKNDNKMGRLALAGLMAAMAAGVRAEDGATNVPADQGFDQADKDRKNEESIDRYGAPEDKQTEIKERQEGKQDTKRDQKLEKKRRAEEKKRREKQAKEQKRETTPSNGDDWKGYEPENK